MKTFSNVKLNNIILDVYSEGTNEERQMNMQVNRLADDQRYPVVMQNVHKLDHTTVK